jgi:adenine-specific DNA-methyltransferase
MHEADRMSLIPFPAICEQLVESPAYLSRQIITYIGNKRSLLRHIGRAIETAKVRLGKTRLRLFDAFAGSGIVSRYLKRHAERLVVNDIETFAVVAGRCFLRNVSAIDQGRLAGLFDSLNAEVDRRGDRGGFIQELYSPRDEGRITAADRVFFTRENAARLDNYRRLLGEVPPDERELLLGPLLAEASVHANTSGVFKGFYKDRATGVGKFGGTNGDALARIRGRITLEPPVLSRFECDVEVCQDDANEVARRLRGLDLAYLDPPYNQHPYGSNYFMLNLLVEYRRPKTVSAVSGIPTDWRRSDYNVRARCLDRLDELVRAIDAPYILVSFNDDGFIPPRKMRQVLENIGMLDEIEIPYNTFRGSRNLRARRIHVTEHLFLVERR